MASKVKGWVPTNESGKTLPCRDWRRFCMCNFLHLERTNGKRFGMTFAPQLSSCWCSWKVVVCFRVPGAKRPYGWNLMKLDETGSLYAVGGSGNQKIKDDTSPRKLLSIHWRMWWFFVLIDCESSYESRVTIGVIFYRRISWNSKIWLPIRVRNEPIL